MLVVRLVKKLKTEVFNLLTIFILAAVPSCNIVEEFVSVVMIHLLSILGQDVVCGSVSVGHFNIIENWSEVLKSLIF